VSARPTRPPWALLGVAIGLLLVGPALHGEGAEKKPDRRKRPGRYKIGSLYLTPRLEVRSAGVDTNVYNAQNAPVQDSSVVVAPILDAALPVGRRFRLSGSGGLLFNWFGHEGTERSTDPFARFRGEADIGSFTLFGETGWLRAKQRFSIDLDERFEHTEHTATVGVDFRPVSHLKASASVAGQSFRIDAPDQPSVEASLDRTTRILTASLSYELTRHTSLIGRTEWFRDTFDQALAGGGREVSSSRTLAGFSFGSRDFLSGELLAGVRHFPSDQSGAAPAYTGPALEAQLSMPISHAAQLRFEGEREVYYSATPGIDQLRNSFVSSRYVGELQAQLPAELLGRFSIGRQTAGYELPYVVDGQVVPRDAGLTTYAVSLLRLFGDNVRIGGGVAFERRNSTLPGGTYRGTRYGFQAEIKP
jgi:Putative beta-barrel porin 2